MSGTTTGATGAGDHPDVHPTTATPPKGQGRLAWRIDIDGVGDRELRPVRWQLALTFTGFGLGIVMGLLQALERLDVDLYTASPLASYYQGLTLHGVSLALVFTFTFANAFFSLMAMRAFDMPLESRPVAWASALCAWGGTLLAGWAMLANQATVLFTFYPPLQATPAFYLGAALLLVSTWLTLLNLLWTLATWRFDHAGERIPLLGYASIVSCIMWGIASVGLAIEVLGFVLPWALGWTDGIDPQFTRILFWFTGHPIVYFWLLPIYVSWYLLLPRQVGGELASDGLTRMVFLAFLILIPVGVHHQFTDPGIPFSSKTIQWILTFGIFYPSLVTAISVVAALESGGRARGGTGLLRWILRLPWGDPSVAGQLLAGLAFFLGGASGLINASYTLNLVVHNTSFVVGHFHLTVGTAVALSIMGISYWLVPYLTGWQLWGRRLALVQVWTWFLSVLVFARGQIAGGLESMPRRTQIADAAYLADHPEWDIPNLMTGIGGIGMFLGGALFLTVVIGTLVARRRVAEPQVVPVARVLHPAGTAWSSVDRIGRWAVVAVVLSLLVYGEVLSHYLPLNSSAPGLRPW